MTTDTELHPRALPGYQEIRLDLIDPSPTNPRQHFDEAELERLTDSIRENGVLEAIKVRPSGPARFELIIGERRCRGARRAGLEAIPAHVVEMADDKVVCAQIAENKDRAGVSPLEEADAVRALVDVHGYSLERAARELGEKATPRMVVERLVVSRSPASIRALLTERLVTFAAAAILARAPESKVEALADKARKQAASKGEPLSRRDVALLVDSYARLLADAPFTHDDTKLTRLNARACTNCPDRTGAQGALFSDAAGDDRCLDAECWDAKVAGLWARTTKDAKKRKLAILDEVWDGTHTGYYETRSPAYVAGVNVAWSTLIDPSEVVIARNERGRVVELVSPDVVAKHRAARPHARDSIPQGSMETDEERDERLRARRAAQDEAELARLYTPDVMDLVQRAEDRADRDIDHLLRALARRPAFARTTALHLELIAAGEDADAGPLLDAYIDNAERFELVRLIVANGILDGHFSDEETLDGLLEGGAEVHGG